MATTSSTGDQSYLAGILGSAIGKAQQSATLQAMGSSLGYQQLSQGLTAQYPQPPVSMQPGQVWYGDSVTTTNTADWGYATYDSSIKFASPEPCKPKNRIKFYRVNEEAHEGSIREPLDELRIQVAKWLN